MIILRTEIYYSGFMIKDVDKRGPRIPFQYGNKDSLSSSTPIIKIRRSLDHLDDLVQDSSISIANTIAILQSCTKSPVLS